MPPSLRPLMVLIILVAALSYLGGIVWAGWASLTTTQGTPVLPEPITYAVTAIGAALATHFGALFGISQFTGGNPRPIPKFWQVYEWVKLPQRKAAGLGGTAAAAPPAAPAPMDNPLSPVHVGAAYLYFGSLVLAAVFWLLTGFSTHAAEIIRTMTLTMLGVVAGVVSVQLNVKKP